MSEMRPAPYSCQCSFRNICSSLPESKCWSIGETLGLLFVPNNGIQIHCPDYGANIPKCHQVLNAVQAAYETFDCFFFVHIF